MTLLTELVLGVRLCPDLSVEKDVSMDVKHGTSKIFGCLIYLQFQIPGLLLAIVRQLIIC